MNATQELDAATLPRKQYVTALAAEHGMTVDAVVNTGGGWEVYARMGRAEGMVRWYTDRLVTPYHAQRVGWPDSACWSLGEALEALARLLRGEVD